MVSSRCVTQGVTPPSSWAWAASREAAGCVSGLYSLPQIYRSGQVIWWARKRDPFPFSPTTYSPQSRFFFSFLATFISLPPLNVKSFEVLFPMAFHCSLSGLTDVIVEESQGLRHSTRYSVDGKGWSRKPLFVRVPCIYGSICFHVLICCVKVYCFFHWVSSRLARIPQPPRCVLVWKGNIW